MLFEQIASTSAELSTLSARGAKVELLAALLRRAPLDDVPIVVAWLSGELPQRQIGVGWASLRDVPRAAEHAALTIDDVDQAFSAIKATVGSGSQAARRALLVNLFAAATTTEQQFLRALLSAGLRQGALAGVMTDAIARAASLPLTDVRRAAMLRGDLAAVAGAALAGGAAQLAAFRLEVGRPVSPMLAQTASDVGEALERLGGRALFEAKLDGARVQLHRSGSEVAIFTRSLDDVTARMPEIVAAIRALPVDELVADGEVIAMRPDSRPHPFQVTASQVGATSRGENRPSLSVFLFDILRVDGHDLLDAPTAERVARIAELLPPELQVARLITDDPVQAQAFLEQTLANGHEGVVAKSLTAPYEAGRRRAGWLKIKPVHTLDLVVLAVEWGSGRRTGKLSNIHLGARTHDGGFVMLGKTFKGMTDAMLDWQTARFHELADDPTDGWVVHLRPEQVVEIAFDGVQRSSRYPGGVALRFARVVRYRDDKRPDEADTVETVRAFLPS